MSCATISSIADCSAGEHADSLPSERLITSAGLSFSGALATSRPAAHRIPSIRSRSVPPHFPTPRTGSRRASGAMPAMPFPLPAAASAIPATCVPCQSESDTLQSSRKRPLEASSCVTQSPGSAGSASLPSPSFATSGEEMKSYPVSTRPRTSVCATRPLSTIAMTVALPRP